MNENGDGQVVAEATPTKKHSVKYIDRFAACLLFLARSLFSSWPGRWLVSELGQVVAQLVELALREPAFSSKLGRPVQV